MQIRWKNGEISGKSNLSQSIQTLAGCSRIVLAHGSAAQNSVQNRRENNEKTSAETWPEKHENNQKNYPKKESQNMKNPEKSGKNDLQKSITKKVGFLKPTPVPAEPYQSPGGTTIQQDILRIGYILGNKLIERKHSEEKNKGGQVRRWKLEEK